MKPSSKQLTRWKQEFEPFIDRIEAHAEGYFFMLRRYPERLDDATSKVLGLSWKRYVETRMAGKDPREFMSTFITLACKQVRTEDRDVTGQATINDVMSKNAQRKRSFKVESLPQDGDEGIDALQDDTALPPEQAQCNLDSKAWRKTLDVRSRKVVDELVKGERPGTIAYRIGVTPGRLSQLRRELRDDYDRFQGER